MFMKVDIDTQDVRYADAWLGFRGTAWQTQIDVRDFIQHNYTPYEGDESFLADATPATTALWEQVMAGSASRTPPMRRWISTPMSPPPSPPTRRAISTSRWKRSSACKRTSR